MEKSNSKGAISKAIKAEIKEERASDNGGDNGGNNGGNNGESVVETKHQRVPAVSVTHAEVLVSQPEAEGSLITQGDVAEGSTVAGAANLGSWQLEAARLPVLPVTCSHKSATNHKSAELHKNRLGSGSRGKCIKLGSSWHTPNEFQKLSDMEKSKDWKKSIRFRGIMLKVLIDEGILKPHSTTCPCAICTGNETSTAPVRPFTPSPRQQRKHRWDQDHDSSDPTVLKRLENLENQINQIRRFASDSLKELAELREAVSSQSDKFQREEEASGHPGWLLKWQICNWMAARPPPCNRRSLTIIRRSVQTAIGKP